MSIESVSNTSNPPTPGIKAEGFKQIVEHFSDPKNHSDKDTLHVSKKEFEGAIGKISPEADEFLRVIVYSADGYTNLKNLQTEGLFNDKWYDENAGVSMRDLYAAKKGIGLNEEDITEKVAELKKTFENLGVDLNPEKMSTLEEEPIKKEEPVTERKSPPKPMNRPKNRRGTEHKKEQGPNPTTPPKIKFIPR